ncbi:hypothetical protein A7985_07915 [Pseudoalteromonas luteoviolacea]|uniref:AAA+ ATPase domain-containing protein n=1 Tax=Pseudoalteromonas luteoviolacea TaxID=43657 RepID=A0A1C0TX86_9GAMM|nr:hypothetical protein [Pseudoalteromonas luteoviolacea]OCQ23854.1 hypothetical protein A7985_07915 [Pseudoalteromonas luteoviolacea]
MHNTKVVAVSGVSGAGKTTVIKLLAGEFNSPFLLFDDHIDQETYPSNMRAWLKDGSDVDLIKTPRLLEALEQLICERNTRFIFIEEPFGKERDSMSRLIDYVILLDPPMELCLARVIRRQIESQCGQSACSISNYLKKYVDHLREIYINVASQVRNNSDLIVQNTVSINNTTEYICDWLKRNTN